MPLTKPAELFHSGTVAIEQAIEEFDPIKVFALVSGGYDSTTAAHFSAAHGPRVDALVHINTGIGVGRTREYVREYAAWAGLPLIEKHPPRSYEDLVRQYGFPGPAAHRYMYIWLKERALREVRREAQAGARRRVIFLTGVRASESVRRMGHVYPIQRDGNIVWVAPILGFTKPDVHSYRMANKIPANPVVEALGMSGECLCGAFAKAGELDRIARHYPEVAARIRAIEAEAHARGDRSPHWGPQSSRAIRDATGPLCSGCSYEKEPF